MPANSTCLKHVSDATAVGAVAGRGLAKIISAGGLDP